LLKNTAGRLFGDLCERTLLEKADEGHWSAEAWGAVQDAGLVDVIEPAGDGQALLPLSTLAVIVHALVEFAVPLPVAEMLLAQLQLALAGLDIPKGPLTVAPCGGGVRLECVDGAWHLSGLLQRVPWGRSARAVVLEPLPEEGQLHAPAFIRSGEPSIFPDGGEVRRDRS